MTTFTNLAMQNRDSSSSNFFFSPKRPFQCYTLLKAIYLETAWDKLCSVVLLLLRCIRKVEVFLMVVVFLVIIAIVFTSA